VGKIQEKFQFEPMTPDLHVMELCFIVLKAWREKTDLIVSDEYFVKFDKNSFGKNLRLLVPVVRYEDITHTPKWKTRPVPFFHFHTLAYGI
jgi:hypothetical protein